MFSVRQPCRSPVFLCRLNSSDTIEVHQMDLAKPISYLANCLFGKCFSLPVCFSSGTTHHSNGKAVRCRSLLLRSFRTQENLLRGRNARRHGWLLSWERHRWGTDRSDTRYRQLRDRLNQVAQDRSRQGDEITGSTSSFNRV